MKRFKSAGQAQRFLSAHDGINNLFQLRRDHSQPFSTVPHGRARLLFGPSSAAAPSRSVAEPSLCPAGCGLFSQPAS
jgi:hypothetical protein